MPPASRTLPFLRRKSVQDLVAGLAPRALLPLALAIGFLFSTLGVLTDLFGGADQPAPIVVANVVFSGVISLAYAYSGLRRRLLVFVLAAAAHVSYVQFVGWFLSGAPRLPPVLVPVRLTHDASWITLALVVSYACFLWFINGTAAGYLRVRAEMDLAHDIHRILVPAIDRRIGGFEFLGFSVPSGEVGGDLVDVVAAENGDWIGYVADVSGHGVSSGVVMGMFKSALRMWLRGGGSVLSSLLADLNAVLLPLKNSAMYVTVACVRRGSEGTLQYAVSGHLPILHVRENGRVDEVTTPQIPVGMFEDYAFVSSSITCAPGELLALITDGLVEVFDAEDHELGLEAVKATLGVTCTRPLRDIAEAIVAQARAHGAQLDDQSLLLVRASRT